MLFFDSFNTFFLTIIDKTPSQFSFDLSMQIYYFDLRSSSTLRLKCFFRPLITGSGKSGIVHSKEVHMFIETTYPRRNWVSTLESLPNIWNF